MNYNNKLIQNKYLFILLVLIASSCSMYSFDFYVHDDPNDPGDGSLNNPFGKISSALSNINPDTENSITVLSGVGNNIFDERIFITNVQYNLTIKSQYNGQGDDLSELPITIALPAGLGQELNQSVITISDCTSETVPVIRIQGFKITGGNGSFVTGDGPNGNIGRRGGGIFCNGTPNQVNNSQNVEVVQCKIESNNATWGGGILSRWGNLSVINCEINDNWLSYTESEYNNIHPIGGTIYGPRGGGVYCFAGFFVVENTKFFSNRSYESLGNPRNWGNAAALYWEFDCGADPSISISKSYFYNNSSYLNSEESVHDDLHCSAIIIQFQQRPNPSPIDAVISNNTITQNVVYSSDDRLDLGALGLNHYRWFLADLHNNIVYNNSRITALNEVILLSKQIVGIMYSEVNGVYIHEPIPVLMKNSDVNDAINEAKYLVYDNQNDEYYNNFDAVPEFMTQGNNQFCLKWDNNVMSPCIDSGEDWIQDIDGSASDVGAYTYQNTHVYQKYKLPDNTLNNSWKWTCFPVLSYSQNAHNINWTFNRVMNTACINNRSVIDHIEYGNPLFDENLNHEWENEIITYGERDMQITDGYKIMAAPVFHSSRFVFGSGQFPDPETPVNLEGEANNPQKNWVGYFVQNSAMPFDALAGVLDHITSIITQKWSIYKMADGSWFGTKPYPFNYGDMVILGCNQSCSFVWNGHEIVQPRDKPLAENFTYTEKADYSSVYVDLSSFTGEMPKEIGLFVNDLCKGAVAVEDSLPEICAYLDEDETIDETNTELVFYYESKSAPMERRTCSISANAYKNLEVLNPSPDYPVYFISNIQNIPYEEQGNVIRLTNYPNPFNNSTRISIDLMKDNQVSLSVYNIKGELVKDLAYGQYKAGKSDIMWDGLNKEGKRCANGVYYLKLTSSYKTILKPVLLIK